MFLVTLLPKIISAVFFLAALYVHNPSDDDDDEEEAGEAEEKKDQVKDEVRSKNKVIREDRRILRLAELFITVTLGGPFKVNQLRERHEFLQLIIHHPFSIS